MVYALRLRHQCRQRRRRFVCATSALIGTADISDLRCVVEYRSHREHEVMKWALRSARQLERLLESLQYGIGSPEEWRGHPSAPLAVSRQRASGFDLVDVEAQSSSASLIAASSIARARSARSLRTAARAFVAAGPELQIVSFG